MWYVKCQATCTDCIERHCSANNVMKVYKQSTGGMKLHNAEHDAVIWLASTVTTTLAKWNKSIKQWLGSSTFTSDTEVPLHTGTLEIILLLLLLLQLKRQYKRIVKMVRPRSVPWSAGQHSRVDKECFGITEWLVYRSHALRNKTFLKYWISKQCSSNAELKTMA